MSKPPELRLVPACGPAPVEGKILRFPVLCRYESSAPPGTLRRPWPQQHAWRDRVRQLSRNPVKPDKR